MFRILTVSLLLFSLSGASFATGHLARAQGIIGILPLPEVFGNGPCDRYSSQPIALFKTSHSSEAVGRIYVSKPWTFYSAGGCGGLAVSVSLHEASQNDKTLPTLEFAYENPGAIVLERDGQWYKVALHTGSAWVHFQDDSRFLPVEQLLKGRLSYLRTHKQVTTVFNSPDHDDPVWSSGVHNKRNLPVEVLDFQNVSGKLWVRVRLLDIAPCTQESTNVPKISGWLPFHDASGLPAIWFYSRGC